MNVGVIVLNYLAYKETINTIESFLYQDQSGVSVKYIIVDNCSPNESYSVLKNYFKDNKDISVIKAERNLGFAGGNNMGYQELCKLANLDYVIISNDDILLPQQGLYQWIEKCFNEYHFAVLGPDVYSVNGKYHQNPMKLYTQDKKQCRIELLKLRYNLFKAKINRLVRYKSVVHYPSWDNPYYREVQLNQTLHGSFQIFSSVYLEKYRYPYDSRTFLYHEEDIVRLRCDKKGLSCVYEPNFQIQHLQAVATNMVDNNKYEKEIRRWKNLIDSMKVYIKVIEENAEECE